MPPPWPAAPLTGRWGGWYTGNGKYGKKKEGPGPSITVTLGLPYPLMSDRVAIKTEVYPGRFTTHIPVSSMDEINEELISWVEEAYAFAASK